MTVTQGRRRIPTRGGGGPERFGSRPDPGLRRQNLPQVSGVSTERQRLLDKIRFDTLQRSWRQDRIERGREGWHGFGNKSLPIYDRKTEIMEMVATNRISILAGETGSGKSTQLAQYALEMGYDHIVYLQPRRVVTDGISDRIQHELMEQFESKGLEMPAHLVGMAHSERATLQDDSIVQVMTSAVFKKRAKELNEAWRDKKILIVADEIHEANIETEFAVATAAQMMDEHSTWSMVLMSATLNEQEIQGAYTHINGKPIPSVTVEGRPHEIEFNEIPDGDVVDVFFDECLHAGHKTLIFSDGKRSLKSIRSEIEKRAGGNVRVLLLHSKIDEATRKEIFGSEDALGTHTVIVSTSAGQSGLTIPGVDRVISDGWTKSPELDAENASGLPRRRCARAELIQQMGRGGRDVPNARFFLANSFKKGTNRDTYAAFDSHERGEHIPPDIYHTVITRNVLAAAAMENDFYRINECLIHSVTHATIREAYAVLELLGAVDTENIITDIGREMDRYPLRPELARAVVEVMRSGSQQQKYRIAAIAAAIEAGGLISHDVQGIEDLRAMLPAETKDDFLAELDYFMIALGEASVEVKSQGAILIDEQKLESADGSESKDDDLSLSALGIDSVNYQRTLKQYYKTCRLMGLDESVCYESLTQVSLEDDRRELQRMILMGMPHLLYEQVRSEPYRGPRGGRKGRPQDDRPPVVWYRNLLGPEPDHPYACDRTLGRRSIAVATGLPKDMLVAGYPRWYEIPDEDGDRVRHIIERAMPVSQEMIARSLGYAARSLREFAEVGRDGRLRIAQVRSLGRLEVSRTDGQVMASSEEAYNILMENAYKNPGSAQRELSRLKRWLEDLSARVPLGRRSYYFKQPIITQDAYEEVIRSAAQGVRSLGELDSNIRAMGITYKDYIDDEKLDDIEANMPRELEIGGYIYDVQYIDDAVPVISNFPLEYASALPDIVRIPSGTEVAFKYIYDGYEVPLYNSTRDASVRSHL